MKLKYNKIYSDSTITVTLSLIKFTKEETAAIKSLGAPQITIDKTYGDTTISIDTTVSDFTNIEYIFNSNTEKISETIEEVDDYVDIVLQEVTEKMSDLMTLYKQLKKLLEDKSGEIDIEDGSLTDEQLRIQAELSLRPPGVKSIDLSGQKIINTSSYNLR